MSQVIENEKFKEKLNWQCGVRRLSATAGYLGAFIGFYATVFISDPATINTNSSFVQPLFFQCDSNAISQIAFYTLIICWTVHFGRRLIETLAFSTYVTTAPKFQIIGAFIYYTVLAVWNGYSSNKQIWLHNNKMYNNNSNCIIYNKDIGQTLHLMMHILGLALFILGEIGNGLHHYMLFTLPRKKQIHIQTRHVIPRGLCFEFVSLPHYFFELVAWFGLMLLQLFGIGSVMLFLLSLITLIIRSNEKHNNYLKEFDGKEGRPKYPKDRRKLCPLIW